MFPPRAAESLEDAVEGLLTSLRGACDGIEAEYNIDDFGDSRTWIIYRLSHSLPMTTKPILKKYVTGYMQRCGWNVKKVDIRATYVGFIVDNC